MITASLVRNLSTCTIPITKPETDKSPEYESLEWLKEVYYAYQEYR